MSEPAPLQARWQAELDALAQAHLVRRLRVLDSPQGPEVRIGDRTLANFSSNDYLGLATHPALAEATARAAADYGSGSGASRLVSGTLRPHAELEARLAEFKRTEAALTFACGYSTALGTLPALAGRGDVVILDKLAHACLVDGARLSGATLRVFPHNDLARLESHLRWAREHHPDAAVVVATESVFSMDGDRAPLTEIVALTQRWGAALLLDEAHATGVIGPAGRGLAVELGLADAVSIQMGTLGKAAGAAGGYVCGSRTLIDLLLHRARSFLFSTAPPPAQAAAAAAGLALLASDEGDLRRERLRAHAREVHAAIGAVGEPAAAIHPWILGAESDALEAAAGLDAAGILAPAIRFPTVPRGTARIRFTVTAAHTPKAVAGLTTTLRALRGRLPSR